MTKKIKRNEWGDNLIWGDKVLYENEELFNLVTKSLTEDNINSFLQHNDIEYIYNWNGELKNIRIIVTDGKYTSKSRTKVIIDMAEKRLFVTQLVYI